MQLAIREWAITALIPKWDPVEELFLRIRAIASPTN
jgi:hypothetical protein